jgi:hypothetical protein
MNGHAPTASGNQVQARVDPDAGWRCLHGSGRLKTSQPSGARGMRGMMCADHAPSPTVPEMLPRRQMDVAETGVGEMTGKRHGDVKGGD